MRLFILLIIFGLAGCVEGYVTPETIRHYENGKFVGKSEVRNYGKDITIRTYDERGRLKSTSKGRIK